MKKSVLILLLLPIFGHSQQFADKDYFLIDSLNLKELTQSDVILLDTCLAWYHKSTSDTSKVNALYVITESMMHEDWERYQYYLNDFVETALTKEMDAKTKLHLEKSQANNWNNIGYIHQNHGRVAEAEVLFTKSLKTHIQMKNNLGIALSLINLGMMHQNSGDIPKALDYYHKSLRLSEKEGDQLLIALGLNNLAYNYHELGEDEKAIQFYDESFKIYKQTGDKVGLATTLNNIGNIYADQGDLEKQADYLNRSYQIRESIGDKEGMAIILNNLAMAADKRNDFEKALSYHLKSLDLEETIGRTKGVAISMNNIGGTYFRMNDLKNAEHYGLKAMELSQSLGYPKQIRTSARLLGRVYQAKGDGMKALKMFKLYVQMKDSLYNEATQKASAKQQAKYAYEKQKALDDAAHEKLLAVEQEAKEKQQILTYAIGCGLALVVIFLVFVFNRLRLTRKQKKVIEEQKIEVENQKAVVDLAHAELGEKNQEILDSIAYAKRIQSAILPQEKIVKSYLENSFILYKPKDIVAGDFYWFEHSNGKILFAAADCTGHGVPGAMVSVVCNNGLNRSVREHKLNDPGKILDKTREIVIAEFEKSEEEVKDGMDIALCSLEGNTLQYAGAHNPLWIIRNGEILETKANKQPIGRFDHPEPYNTHTFELEKGDSIYIFSDGYVDQFGGEKGKKFKAKAFRELLLSIQDKTMEEQKIVIDDTFETWKGNLEQIDDVCVIGVKV